MPNKIGFDGENVYLTYAKRIIDSNDIDEAWCEKAFKDDRALDAAKKVLAGKEDRILQGHHGNEIFDYEL